MTEEPSYATLRDYLRVVRSQWLLIVGAAILFAGAGFGFSQLQEKEYTAEAKLSFREIQQDLNLFGIPVAPELDAQQRAAINAQLITRPVVSAKVKRDLHSPLAAGALAGMISTEVDPDSALVTIKATSTDPRLAANVANGYAKAARALGNRQQARRIDRAIRSLRRQIGGEAVTSAEQTAQEQLTNLKTLRSVSDTVQIAERASVPTLATYPRPKRNLVLAGLVGIVFGLLMAFVRDALDRRLRGPHDIHDELGLPILGRISDQVLGFAKSNGEATVAEEELESFRMLRTNLEFLNQDQEGHLRTVLVTSGLPEEGKSTVAMALAITSTFAGRRTLLVECDLRRPSLAARLGVQRSPGLTDYLSGRASPQQVLQSIDLAIPGVNGSEPFSESATGKLVYISAGSVAAQPAELLGSKRFHDFLERVGEAYDVVVIDSSPFLAVVDTLELVPHIDAIVVCVRMSQTTREEAKAAREVLRRLPERPTGVVVTGLKPRDSAYYGYYYGAYGVKS